MQQSCGGCPLLHRPRAEEHRHKQRRVHQALAEHGIDMALPTMVASDNRHHYRNRFRLRIEDGHPQLFNPAKAGGCLALRPKVWQGVAHLQTKAASARHLFRHIDHLEVRVGDDDNLMGLSWATRSSAPDMSSELGHHLGPQWRVGMRATPNQPTLPYYPADNIVMDVPLDGFVQINSDVNQLLVDAVRRLAAEATDNPHGPTSKRTALDLYAGAGNFALPLANDGWSVTAIERSAAAMATLAAQRKVDRVQTLAGDVGQLLDDCDETDVVVCNPPRAGLQGGYRRLAELVGRRLIYVGCNPARLALDVAKLSDHGLQPVRVVTFDMFPGTDHVESLVVMDR